MRRVGVACVMLAGVLAHGHAIQAGVVQSEFAGLITQVDDPSLVLDDSVAPGLPFNGSYSFDLGKSDASFLPYRDDPDVALYQFTRGSFGVFVQLGNYPFFSWSLNLHFTNDALGIIANDEFILESGVFDALPPANPLVQVDGMSIRWRLAMCPSLTSCPVDLPEAPDPLSSDALLRVPPALGSWPNNEFRFIASSGWECPPDTDVCFPAELFSVNGVVTWVPEASASAQSVLSLFALGLLRARRRPTRRCTRNSPAALQSWH